MFISASLFSTFLNAQFSEAVRRDAFGALAAGRAEKAYSIILKLRAFAKRTSNEVLKKAIDISLSSLLRQLTFEAYPDQHL